MCEANNMKQLLLVAGGVSLSTILFIVLFPVIVGILLFRLILKKIDNHT